MRSVGFMPRTRRPQAGPQRWIERVTRHTETPAWIGLPTMFIAAWIPLNFLLTAAGPDAVDDPPFPWLQGAIGVTALYVVVLILTTQRRDDQLASLREQLTLELAILSEQKSAKIIALLEELRRDDLNLTNRHDAHASDLSKPADTAAVFDALQVAHPADV